VTAVGEAEPGGVDLVLQGTLAGDVIEDAGVAATPKTPKVEKPAAAKGRNGSHATALPA
jgi:hypothetical protein